MSERNKEKRSIASWLGFLLLLPCFAFLMGLFLNVEGSGSGAFSYYRGPVLPMTSLNGAGGVEVARGVDFDFSPYQELDPYTNPYANTVYGAAGITDTYTLTNTTGETKQLDLVYGFQGSFIDESAEFPTITVDGTAIKPRLYPSVDTGDLVRSAGNFETYSRILQDNDFLGTAMAQAGAWDIPVTVYHITDLSYTGSETASYPMLTLGFSVDENTRVWTLEADVLGEDFLMFRVDRGEAWVYTLGGTLQNMEFGGNKGYNVYETSALEGVTYRMKTYESTLEDVIRQAAREYDYWAIEGHDYYPNPGFVTAEILAEGALKRFPLDGDRRPYGVIQSINGLFYQVIAEVRMMYLVFPVTLEPGQTLTVAASYIQEPSHDNSGPKTKREGYDLATKLGSDLNFTGLAASLSHTEGITLGKQNFGFDLKNGITQVALDPQAERYYLEVKIPRF